MTDYTDAVAYGRERFAQADAARAYLRSLLDVDEGENAPQDLDLDDLRRALAASRVEVRAGVAARIVYDDSGILDARCLACGTQVIDDDRSPFYDAATDDGTPHACPARTYVIGLPVVITVAPDGTVVAEVDLSEADDLFDSSVSTPEGQDDSEDTVIADKEAISAAVEARTVTVR